MPCNLVTTNTVELARVQDQDMLGRALAREFGVIERSTGRWEFTVDSYSVVLTDGRASSRMPQARLGAVVGRIKQAVSREAVTTAAKRFGWSVQPGADANHFSVRNA
jgi:hypothetical protein